MILLMAQVMTMLQAQNRMSELETFEPLKFQAVVKTMLKAGALTGGGHGGQSSGLNTGTGSANGGNGNNGGGGGGGNGGKQSPVNYAGCGEVTREKIDVPNGAVWNSFQMAPLF